MYLRSFGPCPVECKPVGGALERYWTRLNEFTSNLCALVDFATEDFPLELNQLCTDEGRPRGSDQRI